MTCSDGAGSPCFATSSPTTNGCEPTHASQPLRSTGGEGAYSSRQMPSPLLWLRRFENLWPKVQTGLSGKKLPWLQLIADAAAAAEAVAVAATALSFLVTISISVSLLRTWCILCKPLSATLLTLTQSIFMEMATTTTTTTRRTP